MTNYMPILPIWGLDILNTCSVRNCFILPALWDIPEYRNFYTNREWHTVIIDNDMYENPNNCTSLSELITIANSLDSECTFIVGPEDMQNGINTIPMMEETINLHGVSNDKWDLMAVLHGKPDEIVKQYKEIRKLGVAAFGVAVSSWRLGFDRGAILQLIRPTVGDYFHAMGLDSLCEVVNINRAGYDSVDSSFAATCAFNNINMFTAWNVVRKQLPSDPERVDLTSKYTFPSVYAQTELNVTTLCNYALNPVRFYHGIAIRDGTDIRLGRQLVDEVQ